MGELVTQAEYARRRGVSKQAVFKAVHAGRITLVDGKVDVEVANREWDLNTDTARRVVTPRNERPPSPGPAGLPAPLPRTPAADGDPKEDATAATRYATSRAVRESYAALKARLDYEERRGNLVRKEDVQRAAFEAARRARDQIMAVPDRCAPMMVGRSIEDAHRVLTDELERVCKEIAEWSQQPTPPTPTG